MDIILDTNVYLNDVTTKGAKFQELFGYLRRTESRLVIPTTVGIELPIRYRSLLVAAWSDFEKTLNQVRKLTITNRVEDHKLDIHEQCKLFAAKLESPAPRVSVLKYDGTHHDSVQEIVRRGAERVKPANAVGEELRDVALWLEVLQYAKECQRPIAFISLDKGFVNFKSDALHEELQNEVAKQNLDISFHKSIGDFITKNALETTAMTEEWLWSITTRESVETEATNSLFETDLHMGLLVNGAAITVEAVELQFINGMKFRLAEQSIYGEARFRGAARCLVFVEPSSVFKAALTFPSSDELLRSLYLQPYQTPSSTAHSDEGGQ